MARIVITEFMDECAVTQLEAQHDVFYDPSLIDDAPRLRAQATGADAIIVRNRTQVRGAYNATPDVVAGKWPRTALSLGREIGGKTLGVVGFGSIGQLSARLAQGMGMTVIAFDAVLAAGYPAFMQGAAQASVHRVDLDTLTATADVISLHVPLVEATRNASPR